MAHFSGQVRFLPEKTRQIHSSLPVVFSASTANAALLSSFLRHEAPHLRVSAWRAAVIMLLLLPQLPSDGNHFPLERHGSSEEAPEK